ncbi:vWA domain-containing protein [Terriglobus tenax]|uniref:vWA domain-containing protein n=1 Tax=Terriglobus tenax TaxID=1111115 RepID=UPI0021DFF024|nr:VWA domain-containing protein [Terriglobus tenax]
MKTTRYKKYEGDLASELGLEELMEALGDFLLDSGFQDPYGDFSEMNMDQSLDDLREAIRQVLENGDFLDEDTQQQYDDMSAEQQEQMLDKLIERMQNENMIRTDAETSDSTQPSTAPGEVGRNESEVRFEVTDKSMDFLGYKALRNLLGSMGRANFGRHDTIHEASGIEASGSSKPYEFGDTLNLDVTATLKSAIEREGLTMPLNIEYSDLHVHQSEFQASCATVVMLDCSHSMILYGEDRFTPAKRVAMALAHLTRTQFPGDSLHLVLFHDSAEEIPISQLGRVKVGPWYTNTREGFKVARRILSRSNKQMKQIVMITDGKPSALTLPDGRIYKNAFGLDPLVVSETLEEVGRCKRSGIQINTFMLTNDFSLVQFVQKVTAMCRGKAYFTTPQTLGNYLLMDFMQRRMKSVH